MPERDSLSDPLASALEDVLLDEERGGLGAEPSRRRVAEALAHEAGKHEAAELERLREESGWQQERIASLMLEEPSKSAGLYAAIDELQARIRELEAENERLRGALNVATDDLRLIAQHARLDHSERGIAEAERYVIIAEDTLEHVAELAPAVDEEGRSDA